MSDTNRLQVNMSQGPITMQMIRFSIPLILGDLLQLCYNTADTLIVGNFVGKEALAAVGSTATIINVFLGLFIGISLGATVLISNRYGAGDHENLNLAVRTTVWLTVVLGLFMTLFGTLLTPSLLRLLGTTEDVLPDATSYLQIYFYGSLAQVCYNMFAAILRAVGDTKRPMEILALSTVLNVVLDLYFIRSLHWGVAGAAFATVLAQIICAIILLKMIYSIPDFKPLSLKKPTFDPSSLRIIFTVGLPFGIQRSVVALSNTLVLSYMYRFGSSAMAGWSIYNKVDQIINLSFQSLSTAITTFVSQNLGAEKPERIHRGFLTGMALNFGIWAICASVFIIFRYQIASVFNRDEEVLFYSGIVFVIMVAPNFICSFSQSIYGLLRGEGHSNACMWMTIISLVVIRQIYLYVFWPKYHSFEFVIWCFPIVWVVQLIMSIAYCIRLKKKDSHFYI